jgi:hypothetical protein
MAGRDDLGRRRVPAWPSFIERAELEGLSKMSVGRLLLDGGTVEEPVRESLSLSVPQAPRRKPRK